MDATPAEGESASWASSPETRATMQANRGRDTKPEMQVRRLVNAAGLRYRVCDIIMPPKPMPGSGRTRSPRINPVMPRPRFDLPSEVGLFCASGSTRSGQTQRTWPPGSSSRCDDLQPTRGPRRVRRTGPKRLDTRLPPGTAPGRWPTSRTLHGDGGRAMSSQGPVREGSNLREHISEQSCHLASTEDELSIQ